MVECTPTFVHPPVVELVLGAQFSPLTKLTAGHFGLFWQELEDGWDEPLDAPVLEEQFEIFDRPRGSAVGPQFRLGPVRMPGRFLLGHRSGDRLLQVQATRFHFNWRKGKDFYPSYKALIAEFEATFEKFRAFTEKRGLGRIALNQWELSYIDSFPQGEYWSTPADWSGILPGLFGSLFPTDGLGLSLEHRGAEWAYELEPKRGRLHVAAHSGRWQDDPRDSLLLHMTARGPIGKDTSSDLRRGLDLGHDVAVGAFLKVVSPEVQSRWGNR